MKEAKKKKKASIETKFNPELTQYRRILKDNEDVANLIKGMVEEIRSKSARGAGKLLTDLLVTLNSTNSNRASVLRDIANIKKSMSTLNLKQRKVRKKTKKPVTKKKKVLTYLTPSTVAVVVKLLWNKLRLAMGL